MPTRRNMKIERLYGEYSFWNVSHYVCAMGINWNRVFAEHLVANAPIRFDSIWPKFNCNRIGWETKASFRDYPYSEKGLAPN